ncbi:hypothetical protein [Haloplanus salilacus]|uniref:hypothetical protein n=1 Tax=Haloplanus salilacus TaxID=2949994 RepID=UPI0030CCB0BB
MALHSELAARRTRATVVIGGGIVYSVVALSWLFSSGVSISGRGLVAVVALGYAWLGTFLTAAVPLYLLARFSLVTPPLVTFGILGNTVYQWLYGAHLHPLSSYLTVWPLLLGVTLVITLGETLLRVALDRTSGRLGLRQIF